MLPLLPRAVVVLLAAAAFVLPAGAYAQTSTIPEDGAGVSTTPPVPLPGENSQQGPPRELPNTGTDPRILFLTGLAVMLIGLGLRLRTADADLY